MRLTHVGYRTRPVLSLDYIIILIMNPIVLSQLILHLIRRKGFQQDQYALKRHSREKVSIKFRLTHSGYRTRPVLSLDYIIILNNEPYSIIAAYCVLSGEKGFNRISTP
jgi:hypothetical protein